MDHEQGLVGAALPCIAYQKTSDRITNRLQSSEDSTVGKLQARWGGKLSWGSFQWKAKQAALMLCMFLLVWYCG